MLGNMFVAWLGFSIQVEKIQYMRWENRAYRYNWDEYEGCGTESIHINNIIAQYYNIMIVVVG